MSACLIAAVLPVVAFAGVTGPEPGEATAGSCAFPAETGKVADVVDGDTLVLGDGQIVRLAGVEAPKSYLVRAGVDTSGLVEQAQNALRQLADGKTVMFRRGDPPTDRHRRILAEVYLEDGTWLQEALASRGLVRIRPLPDHTSCLTGLRAREREARDARRGLWHNAEFSVISAYDPSLIERKGLYVVVEGRVISVGHGDRVDFLNFGHVWRRDFTVLVRASTAHALAESGLPTDALVGKRILVRGILEESGGPAIRLSDPGEIELQGDD